jgi:hypothetical protein
MLKILEFVFSGFWTFAGVSFLIGLIGNDIAAIVNLFLKYLKEKNQANLDFQKFMISDSTNLQNKILDN